MSDLADALVQVCADYLNAKAATADNPDTYQVIIHAGAQAITGAEPAPGVPDALPVSHPAHPMRCHIQDGLAISLTTLAFISCDATISAMIHDHVIHWANGGETKLTNLVSLCKRHHALVHDKGYLIATTSRGFAFYSPHGTAIPNCPPLRAGPGDITTTHDAVITPATIIPPNSGGHLDLNLAIWIAFSNAASTSHLNAPRSFPNAPKALIN